MTPLCRIMFAWKFLHQGPKGPKHSPKIQRRKMNTWRTSAPSDPPTKNAYKNDFCTERPTHKTASKNCRLENFHGKRLRRKMPTWKISAHTHIEEHQRGSSNDITASRNAHSENFRAKGPTSTTVLKNACLCIKRPTDRPRPVASNIAPRLVRVALG